MSSTHRFRAHNDHNYQFYCVGFCKPNVLTVHEFYCVTCTLENIEALVKATIFSTIMLTMAMDRSKSRTLKTKSHLFITSQAIFLNPPALWITNCLCHISKKKMDMILSSVKLKFVLISLSDIKTFSKTPAQSIDKVRKTILPIKSLKHNKAWKCGSFINSIDYLSHLICSELLKIEFYKTDETCGIRCQSNQSYLRFVLSLCKVFKLLVPHLTQIAASFKQQLMKTYLKTFVPLGSKKL